MNEKRWVGYVARKWERKGTYMVLVLKLRVRCILQYLGVDG